MKPILYKQRAIEEMIDPKYDSVENYDALISKREVHNRVFAIFGLVLVIFTAAIILFCTTMELAGV